MLYIRFVEWRANTTWIFNEYNMKCNVDKMKNNTINDDLKDSKIICKTISGPLIASITKSILQHGLFWIIVYILGWYNVSWKVSYQPFISCYMIRYKIVNGQQIKIHYKYFLVDDCTVAYIFSWRWMAYGTL